MKKLSRLIEDDVDKLIDQRFFLEVSSPGLERPLKNCRLSKILWRKNFCSVEEKLGDKKNFIGIFRSS